MKHLFFSTIILCTFIFGASNSTLENNSSKVEQNLSSEENLSQEELTKKAIEEQIKREEKYKKEQKFYMGDDYNLEEHKVDEKVLKHVKPIEPEYDFNMDDVYD